MASLKYDYDKDTDYAALMQAALDAGDYKAAGQYEQQRNAKIDGEGLDYAKTFDLGSVYDLQNMTNEELGKAYTIRQAMHRGDTDLASGNAAVEAMRKQYGYTGGADGSQYNPIIQPFTYRNAPEYTNRYQAQIDDLTRQILGREAFSYDPESDPLFQNYREQYQRNGEQAMRSTMANVAARTGGYASSYAATAGQQAYNGYMQQLADKIPELQQLAYSMYRDQGNDMRANLEMLQALESGDYNKYLTLLGQYNTDRSFDYGVQSDQYDREAAERAQSLQVALAAAQYGDYSVLERLGINPNTDNVLQMALASSGKLAAGGSVGGKGPGANNDKTGDDTPTEMSDEEIMYKQGIDNLDDARAYFINKGYGYDKANALAKSYINSYTGGKLDDKYNTMDDLDSSSILALGLGPIGYTKVEELVEKGDLVMYTTAAGKIGVKWATGKGPGTNTNNTNTGKPALGIGGNWLQMVK